MTTTTNSVGNACHLASSASTLAYTVLTVLYARPGSTLFDADWIDHGFCVVNKAVPYRNTHDLCLYFDIVLVLLGFAVYGALRGRPGMGAADELLRFNLLGHLGHGAAHGFIARMYRNGTVTGAEYISTWERFGEMESSDVALHAMAGGLFWLGLLKGVAPKLSNVALVVSAAATSIGQLFVRDVLGFAYVQTVVGVAFASTQLSLPREEKDFAYAAFAAASIPLSLIPWVESTACTSVASKVGGHLIFDVSIPVFLTAAYVASWHHFGNASGELKKKIS